MHTIAAFCTWFWRFLHMAVSPKQKESGSTDGCKVQRGMSSIGSIRMQREHVFWLIRATSHTRLRARGYYSAWGTNCVSMWMQDGCKVYMDSYMASNGSCFKVTWIILKKPPFGGRPNTKPGDHGTPNAHNHWFIQFYHGVRTHIEIALGWVSNQIWNTKYSIV